MHVEKTPKKACNSPCKKQKNAADVKTGGI